MTRNVWKLGEVVPAGVALALGGGFARGFAHLGVLALLEEHDIPVASITGASIGSVLGAAYAGGMGIDDILVLGRSTNFRSFRRWCVSRLGLAANERLGEMIRRYFPAQRFEELGLPLAVVATASAVVAACLEALRFYPSAADCPRSATPRKLVSSCNKWLSSLGRVVFRVLDPSRQ